ncbi:unnamed protein product [Alternaria alternata]
MSTNLTSRQAFSPSCPAGGTWWSCGYGTFFVGCCARDPCEITCAQGNLYPGAFDPATYGTFPDATCGTGSKFFTCTAGETFWGCCKTNACAQSGCPDGDLEPAILNRQDQLSAYHATGGSTTISSATATSSPSSSTSDAPVNVANASSSTTTPGTTTTSTSATASAQAEHKTPVAAIAGGAAGGAFALAVVVGFVVWCLCFRRKKGKNDGSGEGMEQRQDILPIGGMTEDQQLQRHHIHIRTKPTDHTAPPTYTSPNPGFDNTFYGHPSPLNQHSQSSYDPQDPRYIAYAHHDPNYASDNPAYHSHAHEWHTPPQELPNSPPSNPTPAQFRAHKSMYGHSRGPSELSGDGLRSELDSGGEVEPESPVLGGMWKGDQGSRNRHVAGSETPPQVWMAPQDWASQGTKPTASNQQGLEERREEREPGGRMRPNGEK